MSTTATQPANSFSRNDWRLDGPLAYIQILRKGVASEVIVDANELDRVLTFGRWHLLQSKGYAYAFAVKTLGGKKVYTLLHRLIAGAEPGEEVDHRNRCTLDCRMSNLRRVTHSQNQQNREANRNSQTGIKNVCWCRRERLYFVAVHHNGVRHKGGYHKQLADAEEAAIALRRSVHSHCPENTVDTTPERGRQ